MSRIVITPLLAGIGSSQPMADLTFPIMYRTELTVTSG